MSDSIKIPNILNEVALAGRDGYPLISDPESAEALNLCVKHGFAVVMKNGRAFLPYDDEALVPAWIERETPAVSWNCIGVQGYLKIGSTNERALELSRGGARDGTLIYSETQTAGRGRRGRQWSSPPGAGIYLTVVARPSQPSRFWPLLTHAASVALADALKEILQKYSATEVPGLDLKWPNDVLLSGKKTAGILLENVTIEGRSEAAVVGVGINVRPGSVPENLRDQATCVSQEAGTDVPRRRLLVSFLSHFQQCYGLFERGQHGELLERWKNLSTMWNGVPIWIDDGDRRRSAVTCGVTELGALRIRGMDGVEETLLAGDVSVRRA